MALNSLEVGTGVDWNGTQGILEDRNAEVLTVFLVTWVSNIYQTLSHCIL